MVKMYRNMKILYGFIIFSLSSQNVSSYIILDINDFPDPKLEKNIANDNVFNKDKFKRHKFQNFDEAINENDDYQLGDQFNKVDYENNNYRNKKIVKKIVPHGIAPTGIEFDHKFNTAYRPLVRVHKTKTINKFFNDIKSNKYNGIDPEHENIIFTSPKNAKYKKIKLQYNFNDEDLLQPFETTENDFKYTDIISDFVNQIKTNIRYIKSAEKKNNLDIKDKRLQLVKQIQEKIKGMKSESKKLKAYAKVINALNNILRSPKPQKSGEDNDPSAPDRGMKQDNIKVKKWIPHYPPWNYWTYKKTIHEDVCPGTQVKIGNMCIWTPPH